MAQDIWEKNRVQNLTDGTLWLKFDTGQQLCGCYVSSVATLVSSFHMLKRNEDIMKHVSYVDMESKIHVWQDQKLVVFHEFTKQEEIFCFVELWRLWRFIIWAQLRERL